MRPRSSSGTMLCNTVLVEAAVSMSPMPAKYSAGKASHRLGLKENPDPGGGGGPGGPAEDGKGAGEAGPGGEVAHARQGAQPGGPEEQTEPAGTAVECF